MRGSVEDQRAFVALIAPQAGPPLACAFFFSQSFVAEMGFEEPAGCFALNFPSSSFAPNRNSAACGEQTLHPVPWDDVGGFAFPGR